MKVTEYRQLNNPLANCTVKIGIDPGVSTGVAVARITAGITVNWSLHTLSFWQAVDLVQDTFFQMIVDDDGGNDDFAAFGIAIEVPSGHVIHKSVEGNARGYGRDRQAANVGSNRREAVLLAERFESLGYTVVRVKPTRAKWSAEDLKRITGITDKSNQHTRDAVRTVWPFV